MKNLADINNKQNNGSNLNPLYIILGLGGAGAITYFVYKAWDKKRAQEAIDKANKETLAHTLNMKKTNLRIEDMEARAVVKGKNTYNKEVTINIATQAKKLINDFYNKHTTKQGLDIYRPKETKINEASVLATVFGTPVNQLYKLSKLYSIYTGKSFTDDYIKLSPATREQIKAVYEVSFKYFPNSFKWKGILNEK